MNKSSNQLHRTHALEWPRLDMLALSKGYVIITKSTRFMNAEVISIYSVSAIVVVVVAGF